MKRHLALVAVFSVAQFAFAQLPNVKVPGTNQRVTSQRQSSGTPSLTGVTGTCKNGATRDIVLKVANVDPSMLNNVKVEAHPPFIVSSTKIENGEIHVTVNSSSAVPAGMPAEYAASNPGPNRCDFTVKFYKNMGDQYPAQELGASTKADPSDAYLAAQEKQKEQIAAQQKQIDAAQAQMKKAQPQLQAHQHASVGDKWTVRWASGSSEVWTFSGFDPNMATMALFKGPSGDVKIMFAGMFYQVMMGECAAMAQPDGDGKVSGKTMGGNCAKSGAFTATIE
ncbi:hypothetical protein Acid345_2495 [Candidatus Koribacter versatilis Ellin345]|uniref:Uncharacterized protein n=1 Tax=Koribacter versatilis (strain Ellin345) TaxID=204669 RepID=Q1INQ4_KORVE|nr:flagellar export protein FliJ [Candidatus Koribacter versatilis]ABF41496.1 hypothetical protein Acid345_2495 [Candidatus Koribacter versatilis Ellin345]